MPNTGYAHTSCAHPPHTPLTVVRLQKLLVLNSVFGVCFEAQACGDENIFSDDLLRGISISVV